MKLLRYIWMVLAIFMAMDVMAQEREEVMQLEATSINNKIVQLQWTPPMIEVEMDMSLYRRMQGESDFLNLGPLNIRTQNSFFDTLPRMLCGDSVEYVLADASYRSNRATVQMVDPIPTSPCELKVISVDETSQKIVLSWYPSPDPDIKGYYLCHGNPCLDYDTVWGRENTSYVCEDFESTSLHTFRILAFDSCINSSPLTDNYQNISLQLDYEDCATSVSASWNRYINMPGGIGAYLVMAKYDDASEWQELANVGPNATLECQVNIPDEATKVAIKIVAQNTDSTLEAFSNIVSYDVSTADTAEFLYISSASLNDEGSQVELDFYVDPDFNTEHYTLYRATNNQAYAPLTTLDYNGVDRFTYIDGNVEGTTKSYRYKISALDGCGRNEKFSNEVQTLLPTLSNEGSLIRLQWNPYLGWDDAPRYRIMRRKSKEPWELMGYASQCRYADDIASMPDLNEALFYKVVAEEPASSHYGFQDTVQSAQVAYRQSGSIFFPNAFTPAAETNNRFGPKYTFIEDYTIYIYNRSGDLVFTSTDPSEQWDGTYNGGLVPMGAYAYIAICRFVDLKEKQYTGTVLLIR